MEEKDKVQVHYKSWTGLVGGAGAGAEDGGGAGAFREAAEGTI